MIKTDLHMHTTYCDGKNTPEEMILSGISKGLNTIGLSGHCNTDFDNGYCMSNTVIDKYIEEVQALKEKYKDKITVLCGIEQDYYAGTPIRSFDYAIGSVHYVYKNGEYISVDHKVQITEEAVKRLYNGDYYAYAEDYFELVGNVVEKTNADIIGHFDLVTKFNEDFAQFDENNPRYVAAWKKAVDKLIPLGKPFEMNTGAISRGYRTMPYPAIPILEYIRDNGGKVILSSDSHSADNIAFKFDECEKILKNLNFEL